MHQQQPTENESDPAAATRTTVEEFLRRLGDGDPDQIAALFVEPVDWRLDWPDQGHPAVPWIRPRSTRADVSDHFRTLAEFHVPEKRSASIDALIVDGTDAVLLGELSQTVRATGRTYGFAFALRLTVENSLITRYHLYEDSLTVANALS
jgi:ketosteroid isomerase-like protein